MTAGHLCRGREWVERAAAEILTKNPRHRFAGRPHSLRYRWAAIYIYMTMGMIYDDYTKDIDLSEDLVGAFQRFRTTYLFGPGYYAIGIGNQCIGCLCLVKTREVNCSFVESVRQSSYRPMTFFPVSWWDHQVIVLRMQLKLRAGQKPVFFSRVT